MSAPAKRTIVVVDDDSDARSLIRDLLQDRERTYAILEADTGAVGLKLVLDRHVDCLLLDSHLPDVSGQEFLDSLQRETSDSLPVATVILTDVESDVDAAATLQRGAQDYLVKASLTARGLVRTIENAMEKFSIMRELMQSRAAAELHNRKLEMLRDELEEKVDELAAATAAKDQFMAVMSHEMRTPLNAIIGYGDLLEMQVDGPLTGRQREHVERIQVGGRHLLDLINDILDLARADANRLEVEIRPVDLGAVLDEVSALLESHADSKGLELEIEANAGWPRVAADLNRLRQILTNLVGNAIKFTERGSVRVHYESQGDDWVRIHVTDSGIGIDPDVLPAVFDEFYQAKGDLTREKGGSGLGLAISQRLAGLMGGEILAESVPGEGSTFTLVLPAADASRELRPEDLETQVLEAEGRSPATRPVPVTVVAFGTADEGLAELERRVRPGVRLCWTTDPDAVPELAAREHAALVLLDVSGGGDAAWRAAISLQEAPELAQTAVLLLPSIPAVSADGATGALDLGWLSLVPKPFTAEQLTQAVSAAVRRPDGDEEEGETERPYDVLLVDDDPDSRLVATKFLQEARLQVREVPDGESALVEMRRRPPDVVILDLMMPVLDGFGVLATMRADRALAAIPVVVLTAKSLTPAERKFLARTAVRVLQKGEHRLADVAALVLRAAARTRRVPSSETGT